MRPCFDLGALASAEGQPGKVAGQLQGLFILGETVPQKHKVLMRDWPRDKRGRRIHVQPNNRSAHGLNVEVEVV